MLSLPRRSDSSPFLGKLARTEPCHQWLLWLSGQVLGRLRCHSAQPSRSAPATTAAWRTPNRGSSRHGSSLGKTRYGEQQQFPHVGKKKQRATARKAVATERAAAGCLGPRERLADSGHRTSPGPCHSTGAKPPAAFACGPCRSGLASLLMPPPHQLRPLCHHTAVSRFLNRVSLCT